MKKQLILVPSRRMDTNKKKDRYEDKLIRLSSAARENLSLLDEKTVELWPSTTTNDRINRSKTLKIFKAYSSDLRALREQDMSAEECMRAGFVTTRTFEYICGNGADGEKDIWMSQSIEDTVIGGDPEFVLVAKGGGIKYAGEVNDFGHGGKLASDGPLAEIRPDPTITAEDFVESIKSILTNHRNVKLINPFDWAASCCWMGPRAGGPDRDGWPVGGHIHIGTPAQIAEKIHGDRSFRESFFAVFCSFRQFIFG